MCITPRTVGQATLTNEPQHNNMRSENKGADQLCSSYYNQRLCFRYTYSAIPLVVISKFSKLPAFSCDLTDQFMLDLVANPEVRLSRVATQILSPNYSVIVTKVCTNLSKWLID